MRSSWIIQVDPIFHKCPDERHRVEAQRRPCEGGRGVMPSQSREHQEWPELGKANKNSPLEPSEGA